MFVGETSRSISSKMNPGVLREGQTDKLVNHKESWKAQVNIRLQVLLGQARGWSTLIQSPQILPAEIFDLSTRVWSGMLAILIRQPVSNLQVRVQRQECNKANIFRLAVGKLLVQGVHALSTHAEHLEKQTKCWLGRMPMLFKLVCGASCGALCRH